MASNSPAQLSPSVTLYDPVVEPSNGQIEDGPRLIIIATWAFAQKGHITKYVTNYQELFPSATILVVQSFLRHFFRIPAAREELLPAASVIRNVLSTSPNPEVADSKPALLLHIFSNTGLATIYNLGDVYAETAPSDSEDGGRLPLHATVFDSSPGRYEYWSVASAVMYGVPKSAWLQRLMAWPLAHLLSSSLWFYVRILRGQDWVGAWAQAANNHARVHETCRSYIYSAIDPLVEARAVEVHADRAKSHGFSVLHRVDFVNTAHVLHARADPTRYWKLVRETWEGASSGR